MLLFSGSVMSVSLRAMDCSLPGFPVLHQLPELAQTHVPQVGDTIQLSFPLSSPPPPAFNLSQHQGLCNELVLCIRWPKKSYIGTIIKLMKENIKRSKILKDYFQRSENKTNRVLDWTYDRYQEDNRMTS